MVVRKLDRLGRNTRKLLALIDDLESRGIHFRSLTEGISTIGPMGTAMLTVMSAFAQLERDQLAERTRPGMAAAADNWRPAGRREITAEHGKVKRARELKAQGIKTADIGKILGASRATVYRYLSLGGEGNGDTIAPNLAAEQLPGRGKAFPTSPEIGNPRGPDNV